jgi:hypothetical protein
MVFPGLEPKQEIDDIVAFRKHFDADGKKKLPEFPSGGATAGLGYAAGID